MIACIRDWMKLNSRNHARLVGNGPSVMESGFQNTVLIALHPVQKDRKQLLDDFVSAYRVKHPRLQLVCDV